MEPGQGIRLAVPRPRAVRQGKVKAVEQEGPPGLSGVEALHRPEVLQVAMVRPDEEWDRCSLQKVAPFLQCKLQGQQFPVPHGIVSLCR